MIGKIIRNGKYYEFVELEDLDVTEVVKNLSAFNIASFRGILFMLKNSLNEAGFKVSQGQLITIALAVFEKSAVSSFPVLTGALSRKVSRIKAEARVDYEQDQMSAYEVQKPEGSVEEQ